MDVKLIVGLGNPESRFNLTRHNIGFTIADALIQHYKATYGIVKVKGEPSIEIRQKVIIKQKVIKGTNVIFLKPMDWMNSSGIAVGGVSKAIGINPKDIMVIYDDMDFDFGDYKIKAKGSSGRHNGVQSIIDTIGPKFTRFRIGIGRPIKDIKGWSTEEQTGKDYVLSEFDIHEQKCFCELFGLATQVVNSFIVHGVQKTMSTFNRRKEVNE